MIRSTVCKNVFCSIPFSVVSHYNLALLIIELCVHNLKAALLQQGLREPFLLRKNHDIGVPVNRSVFPSGGMMKFVSKISSALST